jgi:hypothetical protein
MKKTLAIAAGLALFGAAAAANADYYVYRAAPPAAVLSDNQECWNPHARHFERVRPGDYQPDLDFSRCRMVGEPYYAERVERAVGDECWNPRAGHFERVRPGEYQGDLDFGRCRRVVEGDYYGRPYWR